MRSESWKLFCPSPDGYGWTWTFCTRQASQLDFSHCFAVIFTSLVSFNRVLTSLHPISWEVLSAVRRIFPALFWRMPNPMARMPLR